MTDLRRAILDASIALVAEGGVRAVSFREVARRAGVSHQAPYHHFDQQHGLLRAIAGEGFALLAGAMDEAARQEEEPGRALVAAGLAYVAFARTHLGHFRVMFQNTLVDVHDTDAPLGEAEGAHGTLVRLTRAAHRAGHGRALDVDTLVALAWSTVHGVATLLAEGVLVHKGASAPDDEEKVGRAVVTALAALLGIEEARAPKKKRATRARTSVR